MRRLLAVALCCTVVLLSLSACTTATGDSESERAASKSLSASDVALDPSPSADSTSVQPEAPAEEPVTYPAGWLAVEAGGIPAGTALRILHVPDVEIIGHRNGQPVTDDEQAQLQASWPAIGDGEALVEFDGRIETVPADWLLVNLPDVLTQAEYDIVYSYASTSRCAGQDIPGVTGERLPGYADGKQDNPYLAKPQFAVPCAYRTALKANAVCDVLASQGLRLLVYDAYRPMTAQIHLSDMIESAFWSNPAMQESLGDWSLSWYVANGPSGHNFGTDLDVAVCDAGGTPLAMPSAFDAFDETGHLTDLPMNASDITPEAYREAVIENGACMALHDAFAQAGFTELSSEWWHFADDETESEMRALVGEGGLDFVAA